MRGLGSRLPTENDRLPAKDGFGGVIGDVARPGAIGQSGSYGDGRESRSHSPGSGSDGCESRVDHRELPYKLNLSQRLALRSSRPTTFRETGVCDTPGIV